MRYGYRLLMFLAFGLSLVTACGGGEKSAITPTPSPEPDRVVGVEIRCERWMEDGQHREFWGEGCLYGTAGESDGSIMVIPGGPNSKATVSFNVRKVVTVRTFSGNTYTVTVSQNRTVNEGDTWP